MENEPRNAEEYIRKQLRQVNLIKDHKYTPTNVVLVTIDDVVEIFHELQPYTMKKLDEALEGESK